MDTGVGQRLQGSMSIVGKTFAPHSHTVTKDEAIAYARATNDDNPRYGTVAPPMFAVFLEMPPLMEAIKAPEVIKDPKRFLRLLHGEHDMRWHGTLTAENTYTTQASVHRVIEKASGEIIDIKLETKDAKTGALVVETISSMFIRAESKGPGEARPEVAKPETPRQLVFQVSETVAADQSVRYAAASGDHNPIHTDPKVAEKAGLPGIILHGLCTMAFCQKAVINQLCGGDPTKLARLKVRFAKPVLMNQTLDIGAWDVERTDSARVVGLEARVSGTVVLKDGVAEVR